MLVTGCSGPPPTDDSAVTASIRALLSDYSRAVRGGDVATLENIVATDAPAFFREQLALQTNLRAIRTETFEYRPIASKRIKSTATQQNWSVAAELFYAVSGVDAVDVRRPVTLQLTRRQDQWRLSGSTPVAVPWQFGQIAELRRQVGDRCVVIWGPPGSRVAARVAAEIGDALASLTSFWGADWSAGLLLIAAGSDAEFAALVPGRNADGMAAAAVADGVDGTVVGQRVVLAPGAGSLPLDQFRVVLRHELFHAAARAVTSDDAPLWLTEGVADYNGRRGSGTAFRDAAPTLAAALSAGQLPNRLPPDADLDGPGARRTQAYEEAWSVAEYVAQTFGEHRLKDLYIRGAGQRSAGAPDPIEQALGIDENALVHRWRAWLASRPVR